MYYIIALLIFFLSLVFITFAKDSYINSEFLAYRKHLEEPWIQRVVALHYDYRR